MPKKLKRPLDPVGREIRFYEGDWAKLTEIMATRRITPTEVIREIVAQILRKAEDKAQLTFKDVEIEVSVEDLGVTS